MTDPIPAPTAPALDATKPGFQTSEGKIALAVTMLTILGTILPSVLSVLTDLATKFPNWSWIAGAISVVSIVGAVLTSLGYMNRRTDLKVAQIASQPKGFGRLGLLVLLAILSFGFVSAARADDLSPKFGGCLKNGTTCFGPSVSLALVALDLKDGTVTTGVTPGIGYGAIWNADQWYRFGLAGYASFRDTAVGQRIVVSGVFSFAEYIRLGVGQQVGPGARPFLLLGLGSDFGSVPATK